MSDNGPVRLGGAPVRAVIFDLWDTLVDFDVAAGRAFQDRVAERLGRDPDEFRRRGGLTGLVVKRGPGGATVYTEAGKHHEPAMFDPPAVDTTGAGDALAGAMLARWLELGGHVEALPEALRWGVAAATIAISDVGQRALLGATRADLEELVSQVPPVG